VKLVIRDSTLSGERVSVRFSPRTRVELLDPEGLRLSAVSVYPEGTLTEGRIVVSEGPHRRTLHLSGLTGRVTIERPGRAT
jgi:hypothetical protein